MASGVPKNGYRVFKKVICKICNTEMTYNGLTASHLPRTHLITKEEYIAKYGEIFPPKKEKLIECLECNKKFSTEFELSHHLNSIHKIKKEDYVLKYIFNNISQVCKCGCKQNVALLNKPPYKRDYISGHNPNGMEGRKHKFSSKEKMRTQAIQRKYKGSKSHNTIPEMIFEEWLKKNNIIYEYQKVTKFGCIDFYLPNHDLYIEIDGEYWHPKTIENLNIQLLQSVINDYSRIGLDNIIRIRSNDLVLLNTINIVEELALLNHVYDRTLTYKQIIFSKDYLKQLDKNLLNRIPDLIIKFLRIRNEPFPINDNVYNINRYIDKISKFKLDSVFNGNIINNNSSNIGVDFLKSKFKSYWNSSYKKTLTPLEVWNDDELMKKIIEYRIGINTSGEVFNLTLHQLVRGISAKRFTISFFKPVVAAAIYKRFLGDTNNPVVLDPCAGFGGRLLGFKSIYPEGIYIGIEPNKDTYNELVELSKNFKNVFLINSTIEEYLKDNMLRDDIDITFTSIPYYDKETYTNTVYYTDYNEWKNTFLNSILTLPNLLLNIPQNLKWDITTHIKVPLKDEYIFRSNADHFHKNKFKDEFLLKFY